MEKAFAAKTTNNLDIAKFATFIIVINFVLGRFYEMTYLYSAGIDPRKIDITLLDYIRTGIDLLPVTLLLLAHSLFSIKPGRVSKFIESNSTIKKLRSSFLAKKICDYWIPVAIMWIIFLLYSYSVLRSAIFLIILFSTPAIVYYVQEKKLEEILKAKISYLTSLTIKFVLILIVLFTIIGLMDGMADKYHSKSKLHTISLRSPSNVTKYKVISTNGEDKIYTFKGYTMRSFDKITIFDVGGKIVIINNWEILSIEK